MSDEGFKKFGENIKDRWFGKELKTLKDLTNRYGYDIDSASWEDLRDAAREWITELEKVPSESTTKIGGFEVDNYAYEAEHPPIIIAWIKHFFNLEGP